MTKVTSKMIVMMAVMIKRSDSIIYSNSKYQRFRSCSYGSMTRRRNRVKGKYFEKLNQQVPITIFIVMMCV